MLTSRSQRIISRFIPSFLLRLRASARRKKGVMNFKTVLIYFSSYRHYRFQLSSWEFFSFFSSSSFWFFPRNWIDTLSKSGLTWDVYLNDRGDNAGFLEISISVNSRFLFWSLQRLLLRRMSHSPIHGKRKEKKRKKGGVERRYKREKERKEFSPMQLAAKFRFPRELGVAAPFSIFPSDAETALKLNGTR